MRTNSKIFTIICLSLFLTGCLSSTKQPPLTATQMNNFLKIGNSETNTASIFFKCGTMTVASFLMTGKDNVPVCDLKFDGQDYAMIREGEVGKINVSAGLHVASWVGNSMVMSIPEVKFNIKSGQSVLLVANQDQAIRGLGGSLANPIIFSIETDSTSVMTKITELQPVNMPKKSQ